MNVKLSHLFWALLLTAAALAGYHFWAAANAESSLDTAIKEIADRSGEGLNISYTSIDISPFSGDIRFTDINIIRSREIQRAQQATFDLQYTDFLRFMIWGTEAGLRQITTGKLTLIAPSYTNRDTYTELKSDTLHVDYEGNLWDLLVMGVTGRAGAFDHRISTRGTETNLFLPASGLGRIHADTLTLNGRLDADRRDTASVSGSLRLDGITWTPPENLQQQYGFFFRGFGYPTDSIPFRNLRGSIALHQEAGLLDLRELELASELFTVSGGGRIRITEDAPGGVVLEQNTLRIAMAPRFREFLDRAKALFGLRIPEGPHLLITLDGPINEPALSIRESNEP